MGLRFLFTIKEKIVIVSIDKKKGVNPMYIIETKDLTKKYGGNPVVNKVNMHIPEGTIYGFVGENGSGKTTIMRLITG